MGTFVLVPGFWLGAWAWDGVAGPLRADGHEVVAVTLSGPTVEARVDEVIAAVGGRHDVVLVGHSGGGPVVAAAADRARAQLARLVFVDTGPLPDGVAHVDFIGPEPRAHVEEQLAAHDGWYPMPEREWLTAHGSSTEGIDDATWARERARPEPAGAVTLGARRGPPDPTLPKTVVACSFDEAAVRGAIAAGLPGFTEMGGPEWSFVPLPTGHWPMFSEPVALARVLGGPVP